MSIERSRTLLIQIQDIVEYTGISEPTIVKMVKTVGFPAKKLNGTWYSSKEAIDDWMYDSCYPGGKKRKKVSS